MALCADALADWGYHILPPLSAPVCERLLGLIRATRHFDERLFLTESEFDANPEHKGVNPRPGRNVLERSWASLSCRGLVEYDRGVDCALTNFLGRFYEVLDRKAVCGIPEGVLPEWIKHRIVGNPVNNLGAYVRPEYRDITYFYGIDFHQDLIDHPDRQADFVTLYVYLSEVTEKDAPLHLLEGSHKLGATVFPHKLERAGEDWRYSDGKVRTMRVPEKVLTGPAGFCALWHGCTLHGTQPATGEAPRLSLRYLFAKGTPKRAGIDQVNETIIGRLSLSGTRTDLDARGMARVKTNHIAA